MGVLVLALYAEGPSDVRFLPPIIQRTAKNIVEIVWKDLIPIIPV